MFTSFLLCCRLRLWSSSLRHIRYDHPSLPILCITGMITLPSLCTDDGNISSAPVLGLTSQGHPLVSHGHLRTTAISTDTVPLWSRMACLYLVFPSSPSDIAWSSPDYSLTDVILRRPWFHHALLFWAWPLGAVLIFQNHPPCYVSSDSSLPRCQPCTHLIASTSALRLCMHVSLISPLHRLLCMLFHAAPPDFTLPGIVTTAGLYPFIAVLSSLPDLTFLGIVTLWLSSVLP